MRSDFGKSVPLRQLTQEHRLKYGTVWKRYKNGARTVTALTRGVND